MIRDFLPISVALICPHLSSENCSCRKPETGLITKYRELFPEAIFFKSTFQLTRLLNNIKPLSKEDIKKRKKILSKLNQDNISSLFNYSFLSKELRTKILI